MLRSYQKSESSWEAVFSGSLHFVRSFMCTATNSTPHEQFLNFNRRSMLGRIQSNWLVQPGPVLLRRFIKSKGKPLVDEVELKEANPNLAFVLFPQGRQSTLSVSDLAPYPREYQRRNNSERHIVLCVKRGLQAMKINSARLTLNKRSSCLLLNTIQHHAPRSEVSEQSNNNFSLSPQILQRQNESEPILRRSLRQRQLPDRYGTYVSH